MESAACANQYLNIPDVDQLLAFNIVLNTLLKFKNKADNYKPLRMEVSGTAGSGKYFLIKFCVQQATVYLIGGVTLYIFL